MEFAGSESKIVINGSIPLSEYVEALEKIEKIKKENFLSNELRKEVFPEIRSVKRSIYFRPKFVSVDVASTRRSDVITYTIKDQIKYLLDKAGRPQLKSEFDNLPKSKQSQIEHLLTFYRKIKSGSFFYADIIRSFKGNGIGDPARYVLMLEQAGIINKVDSSKKIEFIDTTKDEGMVAALLIENHDKLVGYISTKRKSTPKPTPIQVEQPQKNNHVVTKQPDLATDLKTSFIVAKKDNPNITIEEFTKSFIANRFKI